MKTLTRAGLAGGLMLTLAACTSMPTVLVPYYLPMTEVPVTVTRVVTCSGKEGDTLREIHDLVSVADITPRYMADTSTTYHFSTREYQNRLSDSSIEFNFHDDGRLSGVNASGTGKGPEIIKAVAGVLLAASGSSPGALATPGDGSDKTWRDALDDRSQAVNAACAYIDKTSPNSTKPEDKTSRLLTLTYGSTIRLDRSGAVIVRQPIKGVATGNCLADLEKSGSLLMPHPGSMIDHCMIRPALGDFHLEASVVDNAVSWHPECEKTGSNPSTHACIDKASTDACVDTPWTDACVDKQEPYLSNGIFVSSPARRTITILQCPKESLAGTLTNGGRFDLERAEITATCKPDRHTLASFTVPDSAKGDVVRVPIPVPKAFGGQEFKLALADSGRIKTIAYTKTAMGDAAGEAGSSIANALRSPSAAEEAKTMNDEADRIKAMQRLATCRANPQACE